MPLRPELNAMNVALMSNHRAQLGQRSCGPQIVATWMDTTFVRARRLRPALHHGHRVLFYRHGGCGYVAEYTVQAATHHAWRASY